MAMFFVKNKNPDLVLASAPFSRGAESPAMPGDRAMASVEKEGQDDIRVHICKTSEQRTPAQLCWIFLLPAAPFLDVGQGGLFTSLLGVTVSFTGEIYSVR